jgi:P27 family predicted phage terminase small subunit
MKLPPPPAHLSPSAAQWWTSVVETYVLLPHHLKLLQLAAEAWDRCQQARKEIARDGLTIETASGDIRAHPAVAIERDSRLAVARLVRELDLDVEPPASDRMAPPPLLSNSRMRNARKAQDA